MVCGSLVIASAAFVIFPDLLKKASREKLVNEVLREMIIYIYLSRFLLAIFLCKNKMILQVYNCDRFITYRYNMT